MRLPVVVFGFGPEDGGCVENAAIWVAGLGRTGSNCMGIRLRLMGKVRLLWCPITKDRRIGCKGVVAVELCAVPDRKWVESDGTR